MYFPIPLTWVVIGPHFMSVDAHVINAELPKMICCFTLLLLNIKRLLLTFYKLACTPGGK